MNEGKQLLFGVLIGMAIIDERRSTKYRDRHQENRRVDGSERHPEF